jgi:hypothetical protein
VTSLRALAVWSSCLALPALAAGQGLGGAAAKEKQRRAEPAKTSKPAKTYTEDDLQSLPPVENPGTEGSGAGAKTGAASRSKAPEASPEGGASNDAEERARAESEKRWRSRVAAAEARVEKARQNAQYLESLVLVPGYEYVDEHGRVAISSVEQLQRMTRTAKAELAAAEKALDDLKEEARRASVPPGWLR